MTSETIEQIFRLLYERFGRQLWWPGDGRFEIIAGAILTQNTNWANVEKAIANLKAADVLSADKMHSLDIEELSRLIRPAGYYNVKAKRLKNFLNWLFENYDGKVERLEDVGTDDLRSSLLGIKGVGLETADSILLYGFQRAVFVVDAYTARVAVRHRLIEPDCDYESLRYLFESNLESDVKKFNEYHALLVAVGKAFCKPKAKCAGCPLEELEYTIEAEYE